MIQSSFSGVYIQRIAYFGGSLYRLPWRGQFNVARCPILEVAPFLARKLAEAGNQGTELTTNRFSKKLGRQARTMARDTINWQYPLCVM